VGSAVVLAFARRSLRTPGWRFTLSRAALAITALCLVLGYYAYHRNVSAREWSIANRLPPASTTFIYCGPRWLLRLKNTAESEVLLPLWHLREVEVRRHATEPKAVVPLLAQLPYLQRIETNADVLVLLQASERWPIESLRISERTIDEYTLLALRRCPRLVALDIADGSISDATMRTLAEACPQLQELEVDDLGDEGLVHVNRCSQLRKLHLKSAAVTDAGLSHLAGHRRLQTLEVFADHLSADCMDTIRQLPRLQEIAITLDEATPEQRKAIRKELSARRVKMWVYPDDE
jgi:hypothetical protein